MTRKITTYAFIDTSNLFYGGEKSLGWKIDYQKLFEYIKKKYEVEKTYYLSGDGDFLPVLKYLRESGKKVIIMARGPRTAKEIRRFAKGNFKDFTRLENIIKQQ